MRFRNEDVEKIITQLNIVDVIGEHVELKKAGSNYKGLCPFHKDTNPSFIVSPSKNIYKCFVCGAGGNVVKFYMEFNKLTYAEAIFDLSKKYKLEIAPISGNFSKNKNKKYYEILDKALSFFKENIFSNNGREALEYLNKRGMKPDFIEKNDLGYAPRGWDSLYNYMVSLGHEPEILEKLGLIKRGEKGYYDTFRDRIIFPIYSPTGNVIAFGGRTMSDRKDIAKYLNSPETPVFHKGRNLYGIKNKGSNIRKKNYAFLMEGYMDVLAAHSYGFDVALAPLGTAFSDEQAELLKRYTSNVILAFDMDNPGRVATEKAGLILKKYGFNIRVLELENAKDPDEFLKEYGKSKFLEAVKTSKEIFDFLYNYYSKEYDLSNFMAKQNFIDRFKDFFRSVETELEKMLYLDKLAVSLEMEKNIDILRKILITENKSNFINKKIDISRIDTSNSSKTMKVDALELETLKLSLKDKKYFEIFKNKTLKSPFVQKIFSVISENEGEICVTKLLNGEFFQLEKDEQAIIFDILTNFFTKTETEILEDYIEVYKRWFIKEIDEKMIFYKNEKKMELFLKCQKIKVMINRSLNIEELESSYKEFISMEI
ncbi:MAG: DNA primase [Fusobacteria bacterium]|nr:MAG: DNA primase [Fusobacteriota bacterium]